MTRLIGLHFALCEFGMGERGLINGPCHLTCPVHHSTSGVIVLLNLQCFNELIFSEAISGYMSFQLIHCLTMSVHCLLLPGCYQLIEKANR